MKNSILKFLTWVGLTRRYVDIRGQERQFVAIHFSPHLARADWCSIRATMKLFGPFYVFRNPPGVIKWIPGRLLPRRWGFGIFGLIEIGDRG